MNSKRPNTGGRKAGKKKPVRTKVASAKPQTPKPETLKEEALRLLQETRFGDDGLRVISKPLASEEYAFQTLIPEPPKQSREGDEAETERQRRMAAIVNYEYLREVKAVYEMLMLLKGLTSRPPSPVCALSSQMLSPDFLLPLLDHSSFMPLPILKVMASLGEDFDVRVPERPKKSFDEVSLNDFVEILLRGKNPFYSVHCVVVQRGAKKKIVQHKFAEWLRSTEHLCNEGQRTKHKPSVMVERFNQLAAYRAHRAGLSHAEFCSLVPKPRATYSDASAFTKAHQKALAAITSLVDSSLSSLD